MPQTATQHVENNFIGGLKTDFTGLNFPENAATDTDNCVYSITGEVKRRMGINFEDSHDTESIDKTNKAVTTYKWNNVGGDGNTKILVMQVGSFLFFYRSTDATVALPLSTTMLVSTVNLNTFVVTGSFNDQVECQFTDGNGYLFVFHPNADSFYCSYSAGTITATKIAVQIRDFLGVPEPGIAVNTRPAALTDSHTYNLYNQGWSTAPAWLGTSTTTVLATTGAKAFTTQAGLAVIPGQQVQAVDNSSYPSAVAVLTGTVTAYVGTTLTLNITSVTTAGLPPFDNWVIYPLNAGLISTWQTAEGNYPSNADVWWRFKDKDGLFDPATTAPNVTLNTGNASKGHFILEAFTQSRTAVSGVSNITDISTVIRPKTGAWFQGRVWYAGVDASSAASGTAPHYTWTESIYFSQIVVDSSQFGNCYQTNDPTSEDFADELPSDGGVIQIQGCGSVHKLVPVQNGLLVFAANGIWFITGSQGIGFAANDHTIVPISAVEAMSASSFINHMGYPMFWNEEGIYMVAPDKDGKLTVNNLCIGTISSFYNDIPTISKRFARGDYDPLSFLISWVYRETIETGIGNRYNFNRVLTFNTTTKAFYPYTVTTSSVGPFIHDVKYINDPSGDLTSPPAVLKYLVSFTNNTFTFAEENDQNNWKDFITYSTGAGFNYTSYFITGYKLYGQALRKYQPSYFNVYSNSDVVTSYKIQGIWDFANSPNSGRYSTQQLITNALSRFSIVSRKHKIRGRGLSLQLKVTSVDGLPFKIIGWSSMELVNAGI